MEDRIANLEMLVAEQERTIGELSDVIARHWKEIEVLQGRLERLSKKLAALEELGAGEVPVARPPHY